MDSDARAPTDEELVAAYAQSGDRAAVEILIRRYAPRLRRMVITLIGADEATVLDTEQEVFIALVRRLGQFRGQSRFSTFFYRLSRNRILDLIRSRNRYGRRVVALSEPDRSAGRMKGPEETLMDSERSAMLRRAMQTLRPEDQMILYLKDGEGEEISELTALTGLPAGTVKSRLARSRTKVAQALKEFGYEH
ncbi:MAG: sigma-70 family RNA polymerase sigma factor [Spirochaetales bacterium]|nr:sigma-70 family RNA polymerase sigma factor [Spirochaetales bacterium]